MDTVSQTVELPARRENRRHPLEWKRSVVEQTFEPGASVARVARDNNVNANQVWAWRKLYAQGLLVQDAQTQAMLPVVVDVQSDRTADHLPDSTKVPAAPVATGGSIVLQHGNTSVQIEGTPDATILRLVLERLLR
ncbi:IS66-like element accessory protein TnpA [Paraburkholderia diazotrophica]|uniref:IS66-like element accessory protein TnpA n=1 Tax=Paraburkholderia diazotrophica TaxID=667676 RepID=UPI00316CE418